MKLVKPFGPQIGHTELSDEDNELLLSIIEKNKNDPSKRSTHLVAGYVDWVLSIKNELPPKFINTIAKIVADYANSAESVYPSSIRVAPQELTCTAAWCNIHQSTEFHIIHTHPINDLVCVVYPKIEIPHQESTYDEALGASTMKPGSLTLQHGTLVNNFGVTSHNVFPKTKDAYVFPADMPHFTNPVWDDNYTRMSVSFNFVFNELFYQKRKMRGLK